MQLLTEWIRDAHFRLYLTELKIWKATEPYSHIYPHLTACVCVCVCVIVCVWQRIWSCHFVITSANTGLERVDWSLPVGQPWEKIRSDRPHNTAWDVNNFYPPFFLSLSLSLSLFVVETWMILQGFWKRERGRDEPKWENIPRFHL